jgi:hypothetical protein
VKTKSLWHLSADRCFRVHAPIANGNMLGALYPKSYCLPQLCLEVDLPSQQFSCITNFHASQPTFTIHYTSSSRFFCDSSTCFSSICTWSFKFPLFVRNTVIFYVRDCKLLLGCTRHTLWRSSFCSSASYSSAKSERPAIWLILVEILEVGRLNRT